MVSLPDHIYSEAAAVGVFTNSFSDYCVADPTSVVGENTNNGKHREPTKSLDSLLDHIQSEAAAVGVFTNSSSH